MITWMQNKTVLHNFKFDFKLIAYCEVTVVASVRVVVLMLVYFRLNVLLQYSKNPGLRTFIFPSLSMFLQKW